MYDQTTNTIRLCCVDFEYRNSNDREMELVAVSITCYQNKECMYSNVFWLPNPILRESAKVLLEGLSGTHTLVGFSISTAECRCFSALGLNPRDFQWIDLMSEYRQMQCGNNKRQYGRYVTEAGTVAYAKPPRRDAYTGQSLKEEGDDNSKIPTNLVNCVMAYCGENLGKANKKDMIDLILRGGPWTEEEQQSILVYCASDTQYLHQVLSAMAKEWMGLTGKSFTDWLASAHARGRWSVNLSVVTTTGIPLNVERLKRIGAAVLPISNKLVEDTNTLIPVYVWDKKDKKYKENQAAFEAYLESKGLTEKWPRTAPTERHPEGQLSKGKEALEEYEGVEEFDTFRRAKNIITSLSAVNPFREVKSKRKPSVYERLGSDGKARVFFNPYGSQTGRNQPSSASFIFAMQSLFRCCIQAPDGFAITGCDWSSQEFLIAACVSEDDNMRVAYESGDPYVWLAKQAGAIPEDGNRYTHPIIRELFKIVCLALQFGMGVRKLTLKLQKVDPDIDDIRAQEIIKIHKQTFSQYWQWVYRTRNSYQAGDYLELPDGWILFPDNPSILSVGNFPIQGGGSVVLRRAVELCLNAGLIIIATLHDAIYIQHPAKDAESPKLLKRLMQQAFTEVYNGKVGADLKTVPFDEIWVEKKGAKYFDLLKEYFLTPEELGLWEFLH